MIYLTVEEAKKLDELKQHYSSDAMQAGVTAVFRLALEQLYNQVISLEKAN
jgi:hypothetical protein